MKIIKEKECTGLWDHQADGIAYNIQKAKNQIFTTP